jgi:CheY-like chemotaxis protein
MHRILAVEPEADRGVLLRELLRESLDTDLIVAASTSDAIEAMRQTPPDLILLSMLLAASEEQDLLTHLRDTPSVRHVPVLTIPAVTEPSVSETRSRGLFARLLRRRQPQVRPVYNFNAVIARIEDALEQSTLAAASAVEAFDRSFEPIDAPPIEPIPETPWHFLIDSAMVFKGTRKRARRLPMSDLPWLSSVRLAWGQRLRLLNISSSGVLVESGVRLSPGDPAHFQIEGSGLDLVVPARIVRCRVAYVNSLGVKYETAAIFDRPVDALMAPEMELADTDVRLHDLVAAIKTNAERGVPQADLRAAFETGVLDLITAAEVRLRDIPVTECNGCESIYFTVPTFDGSRAVLQITFNEDDAPSPDDFDVLTAAAQSAATVLPLTGTMQRTFELNLA